MKIELCINGKKIKINSFVEEIIYNTLLGLVKPLRGAGRVKTLSLKINGGGES